MPFMKLVSYHNSHALTLHLGLVHMPYPQLHIAHVITLHLISFLPLSYHIHTEINTHHLSHLILLITIHLIPLLSSPTIT